MCIHDYISTLNMFYITKLPKVFCHLNIKHYIETIRQKLGVYSVDLSLLRGKKMDVPWYTCKSLYMPKKSSHIFW